jgi:hypothetical protein
VAEQYISNKALYDLIETRHKEMIEALAKHEENEMDEVKEIKQDVKELQQFKWKAAGVISVIMLLAPFMGILLNNELGG